MLGFAYSYVIQWCVNQRKKVRKSIFFFSSLALLQAVFLFFFYECLKAILFLDVQASVCFSHMWRIVNKTGLLCFLLSVLRCYYYYNYWFFFFFDVLVLYEKKNNSGNRLLNDRMQRHLFFFLSLIYGLVCVLDRTHGVLAAIYANIHPFTLFPFTAVFLFLMRWRYDPTAERKDHFIVPYWE